MVHGKIKRIKWSTAKFDRIKWSTAKFDRIKWSTANLIELNGPRQNLIGYEVRLSISLSGDLEPLKSDLRRL